MSAYFRGEVKSEFGIGAHTKCHYNGSVIKDRGARIVRRPLPQASEQGLELLRSLTLGNHSSGQSIHADIMASSTVLKIQERGIKG